MERIVIRDRIISALSTVYIFVENQNTDIDLEPYIEDSIQFMSLVVALEETFGIEFPANMLLLENFKSVDTIAVIVEELLAIKK